MLTTTTTAAAVVTEIAAAEAVAAAAAGALAEAAAAARRQAGEPAGHLLVRLLRCHQRRELMKRPSGRQAAHMSLDVVQQHSAGWTSVAGLPADFTVECLICIYLDNLLYE